MAGIKRESCSIVRTQSVVISVQDFTKILYPTAFMLVFACAVSVWCSLQHANAVDHCFEPDGLLHCRTLICTEQCLLHPSRNPSLGREGIEANLKEYLGLKKIIWLWKGMAGDDAITNGHVDNLACFVRPGVVALSWTDDENDPQVFTEFLCCD